MRKGVSIGLGFVGTVIGAGFASGKEIQLYFADCSVVTPLLAGGLLGFFAYLFCEIGRRYRNPFLLFGKYAQIASAAVKTVNAVVYCATLAGAEEVVKEYLGVDGGGVITGLLTIGTVYFFGKKNILSEIAVLAIAGTVTVLFFRTETAIPDGKISPLSAILYSGMNLLSGGFFVGFSASECSRKDSIVCGITSGGVLSLLLVCVFSVTSPYANAVVPLGEAANGIGLGAAVGPVLFLAMYTTCVGTLKVCADTSLNKGILITCCVLCLSRFGFEKIVQKVYPFLGSFGSVFCGFTVLIFLRKYRKTTRFRLIDWKKCDKI